MTSNVDSFELTEQQYENQISRPTKNFEQEEPKYAYEKIERLSIRQTKTEHEYNVLGKTESSSTISTGIQDISPKQSPKTDTNDTLLSKCVSSGTKWKVLSLILLFIVMTLTVALVTMSLMMVSISPCEDVECLHSGTRSTVNNTAICTCKSGYYGGRCQSEHVRLTNTFPPFPLPQLCAVPVMEEKRDNILSIPLKVFSCDRKTRKGLVATSFTDLKEQCKEKFQIEDSDIYIVTENDGCEVDDAYFSTLAPNTSLMILKDFELWTPVNMAMNIQSTSQGGPGQIRSEEILEAFGKMKKKMSKDTVSKGKSRSSTVKLTHGLKNYSYEQSRYVQVRSKKSYCLPSGSLILNTNMDYEAVVIKLKDLYFPGGRGILGRSSAYSFLLGNSHSEEIQRQNFNPLSYSQECETAIPRIYLLAKEKIPHVLCVTSSESESGSDSPRRIDIQVRNEPFTVKTGPNSSPYSSEQQSPQTSRQYTHIGSAQFVNSPSNVSVGPSQQLSDQISPQPYRQGQLTAMVATSSNSMNVHAGTPSHETSSVLVHAGTPNVTMNLPNRFCNVCVERECDAFFFPCGHTACLVCALQIESMGQRCPNCRASINGVKSMFYN